MIGFLIRNWVWLAFVVAMIAMHRSGHGCGAHSQHGGDPHAKRGALPVEPRTAPDRTSKPENDSEMEALR